MAKDLDSIKKRIAEYVSLGDMLIRDSVIHTTEVEQQIHCPFHGKDVKKSARYYVDTDSIYCWVCKKTWDIYNYLMDKEGMTFKDVISNLIKVYKIKIDDLPNVMEAAKNKILESKKGSADIRGVCMDKMGRMILSKKSSMDIERYKRAVFVYLSLKNNTLDDKFEELFLKLNNYINNIKEE